MTNTELAVQLYASFLQASATVATNPHYSGTVTLPTNEQMVESIREIASLLSTIEDK